MNLTKAQKVRLGAFVISGGSLFVTALLILAGMKVWQSRDLYSVRFKESVSGLEKSAQVKYQGLRVGRVESMSIAKDDPNSIEIVLSLDAGTTLYQGTEARLDASGITGLKTINLSAGDQRKGVISPGSVLPAGQSFLDRITGQAEEIAVKIDVIASQLATWTSDDNRRRIEKLLDNLNQLLVDVDNLVVATKDPLAGALTEVQKSGGVIRDTAAKTGNAVERVSTEAASTIAEARKALEEVHRLLGAIETKKVASTVASAESAMKSLDERLSDPELGKAVKDLRQAMVEISKLLGEVELTVKAGREDLVLSLKHVRQATEDLREFSRIIAQDPSVLVRGKESAGE
ncbi:MAG: MCE family protein [Deltaproteobacteria bacterium]|nr:MCE family protein [Deltaproteobacteria bacterium]